ncbi:SPFH domain-containing protein [Coraliomargarita akajimensis]|uniref:Band 7 protein n=1 Tax=Coraliomargarita akajimensis (strain DSM 45221 / IAM 15411 / JCM 23193 / KCTC 12865 / 04OKA010-24) TaxID=583355 RepID=D5EIV7_CORAD|nr:SPFH domain-containing protein [Coraliomargarita akajimensis]ADE54356.1 band 7 protein [Coraliomargarita akajimensis DSM 45221]
MKFIKILSILALLAVGMAFFTAQFLFIRIELGEIGVRTQQYALFGPKGVVPEDFGPGWHRNLPLLDTWNVFDSTVQTTEFTTEAERKETAKLYGLLSFNSRRYLDSTPVGGPGQVELKSKDGYTVRLDVTVKYRIAPDEVHQLYQELGSELRYKGIVRDQVQKTIRDIFGTMLTEQFYDPEVRRLKTTAAAEQLTTDLATNSIELIEILIRDIAFDPTYERKILDKKLADQDVELNKSRALAEEKKGETNRIEAETQAKVRVIEQELKAKQLTMKAETDKEIAQINADARLTAAKLKADADLYKAELEAKGTLLEKEAQAEGERLKATALDTPGGANLVAYELVQQLQLGDMTVSTQSNDFLDTEAILQKVGASAE